MALLAKKSSGAVPVLVFGQLVALFLFVVVPLTYLGAAAGFSKETIEWPARASKIERPIPPQPATLSLPVSALLLWSAFARRGLRRAAGGPLLRLHVTCIVGGGARRGRGGLPRVAQVPRVHLRADQVRLGRRVPLSPFPGLVREVSLLDGVVDRILVHAVGEASSSELHPSSRMEPEKMAVEVHSLVVLRR